MRTKSMMKGGVCALIAVLAGACSATNDATRDPGSVSSGAIPNLPHRAVCAERPGMMRCHARVRTDAAGNVVRNAAPTGFGPADLRSAYALPASGGAGRTIAIVDAYDDPTAESDLAQYRTQYGLPPCTTANGCFRKVNEQGQASPLPTVDTGWASEISLDLDMASAICPSCNILLVEASQATTDDLGTSVNTAVSLGASVVSNSYGGGEDSTVVAADQSYFHHPGVFITASSGDSGFGVQYPASSAYVTAVGGTSLVQSAGGRGWTETAWNGAGSGCSAFIAKPSWQHDSGCSMRMEADVSAVADPNTGVAVFDQGAWAVYGGTSVASPVVASIFALTGNTGADGSYSYVHPGSFFDVTSGTNGTCSPSYECTAGPGYDGPTGNGTPDGADLGGGAGDGGVAEGGDGGHDAGPEGGHDSGTDAGPDAGGANLVVNGGFENGLSGWTAKGKVSNQSTNVHGGTSAAQVGSTSPYSGYSIVQQAVTVPASGTTTLTFWDYLVCNDTITYDWQQAKIVDANNHTLKTIFRTCSTSTAWAQRTFDLTPYKGQTVTLQFADRDDGYTGDPTWWYLDDVVVTVH
jgi:hypothetical protein